jgi:hypothetical protein
MDLILEPLRRKAQQPNADTPAVSRWEVEAMARRRLRGSGIMIDTTGDLFDRRLTANPLLAIETPKKRTIL